MKILIEEVSYQPLDQSVGKAVEAEVVLAVELESRGEKYVGRYKQQREQKTVMTPNKDDNQKLINGLLSKSMDSMFNDPKLQAFLSNI